MINTVRDLIERLIDIPDKDLPIRFDLDGKVMDVDLDNVSHADFPAGRRIMFTLERR